MPQIGAAAFLALLVTGQMLGSIAFDNFGWLGLTQRPIDTPRLIGVALLDRRRRADPALTINFEGVRSGQFAVACDRRMPRVERVPV